MQQNMIPPTHQRPVYTYNLPKDVAEAAGFGSISLVELTSSEEMMATARASGDPIKLAFELGKQCIVKIDGKPVSLADGSLDTAWQRMPPKARSLVMTGYGTLHQNKSEAVDVFLQSRQIEVG